MIWAILVKNVSRLVIAVSCSEDQRSEELFCGLASNGGIGHRENLEHRKNLDFDQQMLELRNEHLQLWPHL